MIKPWNSSREKNNGGIHIFVTSWFKTCLFKNLEFMFYFLKKMDRETDAWITALISLRVITQAAKSIFFYIKLLTPAFPI